MAGLLEPLGLALEPARMQQAAILLVPVWGQAGATAHTYNYHSPGFRDWRIPPIPSRKPKPSQSGPKTPCPRHATVLPIHVIRLRLARDLIQEAFVLNHNEPITVDDRAGRLETFQRLVHALPGNAQHIGQIFLADKCRDPCACFRRPPI